MYSCAFVVFCHWTVSAIDLTDQQPRKI